MFAYQVNDMTCGHCVTAITAGVHGEDRDAKVEVDLGRRLVFVETSSAGANADALRQAINAAGYEAAFVESEVRRTDKPRTSGSCCGAGASCCGA